jgi:hypothetical protein
MEAIHVLRACLVAGQHKDAGTVLQIDADISADDAAQLVRHGVAEDIMPALPDDVEIVDLDSMKIEELQALADELGIDLGGLKKKSDIIDAITAERAAALD